MNQGPLFTVCICTYNDSGTIAEFFESVSQQLDEKYEIVVVDGGSNDGTREFLESQREALSVPMQVLDQRKTGLGRARQQCVEAANGTYLLEQVDADMRYADCFDSLLSFYLDYVNTEGPVQLLTRGMRITPKQLHEELGGWRPYPHGFQENELTRRFFRHGYLRLLDVKTAQHIDVEHDLETAIRWYVYNYREKFRSGLSPRYALSHLYESNLPIWRKVLDTGTIATTYLWARSKDRVETFNRNDPLAYEIDDRLYEGCESGAYDDIRLDAPPDVEENCFDADVPDKAYSYTDTSL
ncbi:glycosyltransferase family 2 protein [Halobacterium noricense]|uniref:glycosyltransferase family 2 protein n=1 Tax=Halobacterium noricense TaxID=223182 RepID=UPI001E53ABAC|nr:glycosyltransferase [Halobacterium noricense]UHH26532.1 glycosyltransferase [Halobacterium noricense]